MEAIIPFLTDLGSAGLDIIWLPVIIWTIAALAVIGGLNLFEKQISTLYNYHMRVALLWGLAAGVLGAVMIYFMPAATSAGSGIPTKFIVIQNPITVEATATSSTVNWAEPALWVGLITALTFLAAIGSLMKLIVDFMQLRLFSGALNTAAPNLKGILNPRNQRLLLHEYPSVKIIFSEDVSIPCTFGWLQKRIVLPAEFMDDPEKLNMAVRHELVHIKSNDFLVHTTVRMIRALFSFHPLVHKIAANIEPYREMNCDQHVLQDADISQQNYARLLFELLPQPIFKTAAAVNMAVNPSTLKKRIQTMKQSTPKNPSLRWSFSLMLACTLTLTGLMACSDIEEGGITRSEIEDTQANINKAPADDSPLYIVNGEQFNNDPGTSPLSRIKPKYIESIDVLKGQKATDEYGKAGKNGVINITLIDKEKAFSDLRKSVPPPPPKKPDGKRIFIAVENQPELKGNMAQLQRKVKYPAECKSKEIEGRVTVQFVVDTQGKVQDPNVIRGIGGGCDEEAVRVIKQAEFTPGTQRGKKVNVQMSMPIVFKMNS